MPWQHAKPGLGAPISWAGHANIRPHADTHTPHPAYTNPVAGVIKSGLSSRVNEAAIDWLLDMDQSINRNGWHTRTHVCPVVRSAPLCACRMTHAIKAAYLVASTQSVWFCCFLARVPVIVVKVIIQVLRRWIKLLWRNVIGGEQPQLIRATAVKNVAYNGRSHAIL